MKWLDPEKHPLSIEDPCLQRRILIKRTKRGKPQIAIVRGLFTYDGEELKVRYILHSDICECCDDATIIKKLYRYALIDD
jgi:hypothetical protein